MMIMAMTTLSLTTVRNGDGDDDNSDNSDNHSSGSNSDFHDGVDYDVVSNEDG